MKEYAFRGKRRCKCCVFSVNKMIEWIRTCVWHWWTRRVPAESRRCCGAQTSVTFQMEAFASESESVWTGMLWFGVYSDINTSNTQKHNSAFRRVSLCLWGKAKHLTLGYCTENRGRHQPITSTVYNQCTSQSFTSKTKHLLKKGQKSGKDREELKIRHAEKQQKIQNSGSFTLPLPLPQFLYFLQRTLLRFCILASDRSAVTRNKSWLLSASCWLDIRVCSSGTEHKQPKNTVKYLKTHTHTPSQMAL